MSAVSVPARCVAWSAALLVIAQLAPSSNPVCASQQPWPPHTYITMMSPFCRHWGSLTSQCITGKRSLAEFVQYEDAGLLTPSAQPNTCHEGDQAAATFGMLDSCKQPYTDIVHTHILSGHHCNSTYTRKRASWCCNLHRLSIMNMGLTFPQRQTASSILMITDTEKSAPLVFSIATAISSVLLTCH